MYYPISGGVVEIDEEDLPLISCFKWWKEATGYARTAITVAKYKQQVTKMHRLLTGFPLEVDHINGDRLDNRKENLRSVDRRTNCRNRHDEMTSQYPCVSWAKHANKWRLRIWNGNKHKHYGYFETEEEANEMRRRIEYDEKLGKNDSQSC